MTLPVSLNEAADLGQSLRNQLQDVQGEINRLGSTPERVSLYSSLNKQIKDNDNLINEYINRSEGQPDSFELFAKQRQDSFNNALSKLRSGTKAEADQAVQNAFDIEKKFNSATDNVSNTLENLSPNAIINDVSNDITSGIQSTIRSNSISNNNTQNTLFNSSTTVMGTPSETFQVDHRIRLRPKSNTDSVYSGIMTILSETNGLMFPYTPNITVSQSVNYAQTDLVHANQNYYYYTNTPAQSFTINGQFSVQNSREGIYLLACMQFLRTMTKMRFGDSSDRGLPPPLLLLSGYGDYMFNNLPVILRSFSWDMLNNIDYIEVNSGSGFTRVPSLCTLTVEVIVQQTPSQQKTFNWDEFASGQLLKKGGWF